MDQRLEDITPDQLFTIARGPWMRLLYAELRAAGMGIGYSEGNMWALGLFGGNPTIDVALSPTGYPKLALVFSEENLPTYLPGYVAEFYLELDERDFLPLAPTRIGRSVSDVEKHFDTIHPPHLVRYIQQLLDR